MYEHEDFDDTVDALLRPIPPPPSATLRVADLYCGDRELGQLGQLGQAAKDAGLDVVYAREPESAAERLDFELIPPFDSLTASMPDTNGGHSGRGDAVDFVLRFLRVRRPAAFLLMTKNLNGGGKGFLRSVRSKTNQLGYRVNNAGQNGHAFVVGALAVRATPVVRLAAGSEGFEEQAAGQRGARSRRGVPALSPAVQSAVEQIMRNVG